MRIEVILKNGERIKFPPDGREIGHEDKVSIRYEGEFAVITDKHYNEQTIFPACEIMKITTTMSGRPY